MRCSLSRLVVLAACGGLAACAPRSRVVDSLPAPQASPTPVTWTPQERSLLALGVGAGRFSWDDPPVRAGERVRWLISGLEAGEVRIDAAREDADRWTVRRDALSVTLLFTPETVAALDRRPFNEANFAAAGGRFVGNEVVRVPSGDFRARHGVIQREGILFHLYVARAVPGGLVKLEEFREGEDNPHVVWELEDFFRLKKEPFPNPLPPASPSP